MPAFIENIRELRITRHLPGWIPLFVGLLGIGLTTPAAKADFILEYTGAPFSNSGVNCSQSQCLEGNVTLSFFVNGSVPTDNTAFCLSVATLGTAQGDCLTVQLGFVRNGATTLKLVDNPNNLATFTLDPAAPSWLVYLDGLSDQDPPSQVLLTKTATGGSELLKLNDSTLGQAVGRNNTAGNWTYTDVSAQQTPEPATWTAIGLGLGLIGLIGRKRTAERARGVRDRGVPRRGA